MQRLLAWIRFMFERALLRGLQYRLMLAVAVVATVAVGGGALVVLFDPSISQWDEGVWWAFLRLTDPGYLVVAEVSRIGQTQERPPHALVPLRDARVE